MTRRITLDLDDDLASWIATPPGVATVSGREFMADRLIGAARHALLGHKVPAGIDRCPTCDGIGCERCLTTGRRALAKLHVLRTSQGRADLRLWYGAPGTMQPVLPLKADQDLADIAVDGVIEALQTGGLIIEDKR